MNFKAILSYIASLRLAYAMRFLRVLVIGGNFICYTPEIRLAKLYKAEEIFANYLRQEDRKKLFIEQFQVNLVEALYLKISGL